MSCFWSLFVKKKKQKSILVINGPNLDIIEKRENGLYSKQSIKQIESWIKKSFPQIKSKWIQSNSEEQIIKALHTLIDGKYDGLVINPAAFTHTSIAILDALRAIKVPKVEVHFTNTHSREDYRKTKFTTTAVNFAIEGFGKISYFLAFAGLDKIFSGEEP